MRIPTSFSIGRKRYVVRLSRKLGYYRLGYVDYDRQTIDLATTRSGERIRARPLAKTFWHEVVHAILHDIGHPLTRNEAFVDAVAVRLTSVVFSAAFDD